MTERRNTNRLAIVFIILLNCLADVFLVGCTSLLTKPVQPSPIASPSVVIKKATSTTPPTTTSIPSQEPTQTATFAPALTVKLLTYNILYGAGVDRSFDPKVDVRKRTNQLPLLLDMLKRAKPDLIGLQEAAGWDKGKPSVVKQVADELGMEYFLAKSTSGDLHTVLLSRFPIETAENLSGLVGEYSALHATVITPDRKPLNVFVVQLSSDIKPYNRICQTKILLPYLVPYSNQRSIIMGDFNSGFADEPGPLFDQAGWKAVEYGQKDQIRVSELVVWGKADWHPFKIVELSSISDHPPIATKLQFYDIPWQHTSTPLPPVEVIAIPEPVNRYLKDAYVKFYWRFDQIDDCYKILWKAPWRWVTVGDAGLNITGRQKWETKLDRYQFFTQREGILLSFKVAKYTEANFSFHTGISSTNRYRQWGVRLRGQQILPNLYLGTSNLGGPALEKGFELQEDTWYNMLLALGDNGSFMTLIWDPDDPSHVISYTKELGNSWDASEWRFSIEANSGNLYIRDFHEIRFSTFTQIAK